MWLDVYDCVPVLRSCIYCFIALVSIYLSFIYYYSRVACSFYNNTIAPSSTTSCYYSLFVLDNFMYEIINLAKLVTATYDYSSKNYSFQS